jgi:hypothetical protein
MNIKYFLLMIAFVSVSCSSAKDGAKDGQKSEVVIEDGYKTTENNEVLIEDNDLKQIQQAVVTSRPSTEQNNVVAYDGSKISVMLDGYGNKSETRYFENDARLQMVLVRTSVNGQKQIFIYGQNGEVKDLPPSMIDKALSMPAGELANAAGIVEGRRERTIAQSFSSAVTSSAVSSIQTVPAVQTENQTIESSRPQVEVREETLARQNDATEKKDASEETRTPPKSPELYSQKTGRRRHR